MTPDWSALAPHKPLQPLDDHYVTPPSGSAEAAASWILADGSNTVLLGGPVGVGKSTELARAAALLEGERVACLARLDRSTNMRQITVDDARRLLTANLVTLALGPLGLHLSPGLSASLSLQLGDALPGALRPERPDEDGDTGALELSPSDLLDLTLRELTRKSGRRICLLVDGLEKSPEHVGRPIFEALAELEDHVDLVVVIPWYAAFGPGAETVLRSGERLVTVRAAEVAAGDAGALGRQFLCRILERRLDLPGGLLDESSAPDLGETGVVPAVPDEFRAVVHTAAVMSGGVPRVFLQLLADAATYARLRLSAAPWPRATDLEDALADQRDTLRRILMPGDRDRIREADGTDGTELELDAKVRLMAHGFLLERSGPDGRVLRPHPLLAELVAEAEHA